MISTSDELQNRPFSLLKFTEEEGNHRKHELASRQSPKRVFTRGFARGSVYLVSLSICSLAPDFSLYDGLRMFNNLLTFLCQVFVALSFLDVNHPFGLRITVKKKCSQF